MVTPDKDFAQLVSENIFMYRPARKGNGIEIIPSSRKFEVERPEQVIDYLGMMGDSVDNIPGLPGVGDKTAKKFLKKFVSMENLLDNLDQVQGNPRKRLRPTKIWVCCPKNWRPSLLMSLFNSTKKITSFLIPIWMLPLPFLKNWNSEGYRKTLKGFYS